MDTLELQPGTLWPALLRQTEHALRCQALRPIQTTETSIEDHGVRFVVRQVSSLALKARAREAQSAAHTATGAAFNPFLPYDADLFVASISPTHVALLNKFNVIDHHLLIVTRAFERQEALLDRADFTALAACMAEFDGLAFYNGGAEAGASQPHKHLQMVPLAPHGSTGGSVPMEAVWRDVPPTCGIPQTVPALPFRHAFCRLDVPVDAADGTEPAARRHEAAQTLESAYRALLQAAGRGAIEAHEDGLQRAPYNLLVTRRWMLLVPRAAECVEGVSVNALGFAGSLFVRDAAQMNVVKSLGPMKVLERVTLQ
ncbi:ATP adenylyltransferase family protein [Paraburkholderia kururiensis]|uniref:DUF4922 domain-containing protein n=1 Tax=Paraburkholderia kururiensis TaxID=984307 RepID=A0ABZ0WJI8_9BURK|nr:DUF4922 domain-containing protein [Paraburkholderia kururiensis]WQD77470.1 DUF4922 domain-containing protein [Paraburkholderia kururiensis]